MAGTGRSTEPSTERKGSNTPGESSDVPAANGSRQHGHAQSQEQLQGLGVAASLLQQQHQNLEAAQAHATAAAIEVQRQQGLLAAAAQAQGSRLHHGSHHNLAAAAQAQAAQHQRTMEVAAESHMQHQQFMAAAAQAHLQHRQDMTAAAQARAQQQADLAEAQMAYGGSGGAGGSGGRRGTEGSGSGQNAAPSVGAAPVDASRMSFMQGAQQQHSSTGTNGIGNGGFQQVRAALLTFVLAAWVIFAASFTEHSHRAMVHVQGFTRFSLHVERGLRYPIFVETTCNCRGTIQWACPA